MHQFAVLRYMPVLGFAVLMMWFLATKWQFISEALSETNGRGSATRIAGMILTLVVALNEIYTTVKTQEFKYQHLVALLVSIGVLFGFIKVVDLFSIYKTGKLSEPAKSDPTVTTTTTTEVKPTQ